MYINNFVIMFNWIFLKIIGYGKLIPAETGAKIYRNVDFDLASQFTDEEPLETLEEGFM